MRKTLSPAQKKVKGSPSPGRTTRSTTASSGSAVAAASSGRGAGGGAGGGGGGGGGAAGAARRRTPAAASASKPTKPTSGSTVPVATTKAVKVGKTTTTTSTASTTANTAKGQHQTANKKVATSPTAKIKIQAKSKLRKVIAGKVRPTSNRPIEKKKKKTTLKKQVKKEKDEDVNKEPVEVVIHVKKPKNKVIRPDSRTGVASGKIGKRKTTGKQQQQEMKKKLLKKLSGKMEEKLESVVNTILEVAVVAKKVVPKGKTTGNTDIIKNSKEKIKKEKKKVKVKEDVKKVEIKEEKKDKEVKEVKDTKEKEVKVKKEIEKKPVKEVKKEIKVEKKEIKEEKKEDKEVKKEVAEVQQVEKKVKEEIKEEVKEPKEEKKAKEPKPKSKKPKKDSEDCINIVEVESENTTVAKEEVEPIKSQIPVKETVEDLPSTPNSPAELLVKKKVKLKTEEEPKKEEDADQKKVKRAKAPAKKEPKVQETKKDPEPSLEESKRRMKLFGFWEGPKRHREASLNALAKVHCLYENESRGAMMEMLNKAVTKQRVDKKKGDTVVIKEEVLDPVDDEEVSKDLSPKDNSDVEEVPKRNLRSTPGMRSVGRCWDVEPLSSTTSPSPSSSSSDESSSDNERKKKVTTPRAPSPKEKQPVEPNGEEDTKKKEEPPVKKVRKRRKRCELMMDLKDMVVRKRMASLNASAMLAASYSMEKRSGRGDEERRRRGGNRSTSDDSTSTSMEIESSDDEVIVSGASKKVAVIVNQDTDVTITGLYVNSTTRSTRHCSITGMQYRISSTSHTQTESTAVTTETVIHTSDHVSVSHSGGNNPEAVGSSGGSCKTYTPLGALSSMQPPGGSSSSPLVRRHPCSTSAFSAPPPPYHHPHQEIHGYYQPAGPLISHHHLHPSASTSSSLPPVVVSSVPPPAPVSKGSPASSGASDSVGSGQQPPASAQQQQEEYRAPLAGYPPPYSYPYLQAPPPPSPYHQDCYSGYYHQKYPPSYPARRYWPSPGASSQMVSSEPPYPTQAPLVEPYPHGPPPPPPPHPHPHYYGYPPGPPAPCSYSHSPPGRGPLPPAFMDPSFTACPCPMQPCPKNVHTGPLTGASKGPGQLAQAQTQQPAVIQQPMEAAQQQVPLPPVVLALPPEPSGAIIGPPSPARGSAGMPPPASPALSSTARNPPAWSPPGLLTTAKPEQVDDECCRQRLLPEELEEDVVNRCEKTETPSITPPPVQTVVELPPLSDNTVVVARRARPATKRKSTEIENVEINCRPSIETSTSTPVTKSVTVSTATTATMTTAAVTAPPPAKRRRSEPAVTHTVTEPVVTRGQAKKITKCEPLKALRRPSKSTKSVLLEGKKQLRKKPPPTPPPRPPTPVQNTVVPQKVNGVRQKKETLLAKSKKSKTDSKKENGRKYQNSTLEDNSAKLLLPAICRTHPTPKWSNGWSWEGEPFTAKVFLSSDDNPVLRKCYPAMRHIEGDVIHPKDCVLLKSGQRKQLPFIAKVAAMWDNPEDGEMMVSLLWYYRPEHTEQGRNSSQPLDEIFASRHKDTNSVACIEDKCYVLTYNEYCRYKKNVCISEAGIVKPRCSVVPNIESGSYPRADRLPPGSVASENVFFCRKVYDFRQRRILKNPSLWNNNNNNISHN